MVSVWVWASKELTFGQIREWLENVRELRG